MAKSTAKAEFGDFQTPPALAQQVCTVLARRGLRPASLIEPTCGLGRFLIAALDEFPSIERAVGLELNPNYLQRARATLDGREDSKNVELIEANFFATDWEHMIRDLPEPILVVGNLPWVTNSHLAAIGSENLPLKSNFQNHNGLAAMTGKANFDISEWMLMRLLEAMNGRRGTLAILCKSATARKVFRYGCEHGLSFHQTALLDIDAALHFDAAVSAALLVMDFEPGVAGCEASVYPSLKATEPATIIGFEDGCLLANVGSYRRWKHLAGDGLLKWRSGIKHDCSRVMELRRENGMYRNGLGELVELEDEFLYPMFKSSDLASQSPQHDGRKFMLVTQRSVGESTERIRDVAPKIWAYLTSHRELFERRGSAIYKNRPPFSIFGAGEYSFAPWKVAISGFYKRLTFTVLGPENGKPRVLDDTSYFLPCESQEQAECLASLLNSPIAQSFYSAFVFWDGKRPITAELLRRLDLERLAHEMGAEVPFKKYFPEVVPATRRRSSRSTDRRQATLPLSSD
jgi:hypothetical protein